MKKRILSIVLCLCLVLVTLPATAFAAGDMTVSINGVPYTADSLEAAIGRAIADTNNATAMSLDTIASIEVTAGEVESEDWDYIKNIQSDVQGSTLKLKALTILTVADEVTAVADLPVNFLLMSFYMSTQSPIQRVEIAGVENINGDAFGNCPSLSAVRFSDAVTIGGLAFDSCTSLTSLTDVNFPEVTTIDDYAFRDCTSLTDVSLPKVTTIDDLAFDGCASLTSASFPDVVSIGGRAFDGCSSLTSASFPATPPAVVSNSFSDTPTTRYLTLVDADGTPLSGQALTTAIAAYAAVLDGDNGTSNPNGWYGWTLPELPQITTHPTDATANESESATFTVAASGTPEPGYQWYKDGVEIPGAKNASYTIDSVAAGDTGSYTCTASNSQGSATSDPATLTVNSPVSSGGHSSPTYPVTVSDTQGGSVATSPKRASTGATVTITPKPDEGKQTDKIIVTDKDSKEITASIKSDGTYSFQQPRGGSTVTVTFKDIKWDNPFADVKDTDWFYGDAQYAIERGLMNGTSSTTFNPYLTTSRSMIATILWRLEGSPVVNYAMSFADVPGNAYYAEAVRWAAANHIADGYGNGKFGANDPITREQLATLLYRYAQHKGEGFTGSWMFLPDYPDRNHISSYAYEGICWMTMNHIINGRSNGTLDPQGNATRAESAAMLHRFADSLE